jgi:type I restriction enzyme S subunit
VSRYKPYPQYKDSGVEWLGKVPEHWNIFQIKRSIDGCSNGIWGEEPNGLNDLIVIRVADFNRDNFTISEEKLTYRAIEEKDRCNRLLKQNDLLIEKSGGGENQLVGTVVSFNKNFLAVTSNFVAKMTCKNDFNARYLTYSFAHLYAKRVNYMSIKQTTGIQNLDSSQYLSEDWSFPSLLEQQFIANFLDSATCKIDTLIQKQQNLIELLKEKRQALISHTVTKGLNPHVKMKDSGVEWLGEVPEHWKILQLKRISSIKGGYAFSTADFVDDGVQIIKIGNVYQSKFHIDRQPTYVSQEIAKETKEFLITEGDLIISLTGTLGKRDYGFAVTVDQKGEYLLNQRVAKMLPNKKLVELIYFSYVMKSEQYLTQIYALPSGTKQANLSNENVLSAICSLPALLEQRAISNYLDNATCKIDTLISKAQKAIELLKERRTALISSVVTGKIDVREIA